MPEAVRRYHRGRDRPHRPRSSSSWWSAIYLVITYNGLVSLRNRIENAWAQIDVQLKRRYDLIPNLVETVKGYATHERETLEAVIQARNMAMTAQGPHDQANAENMLTGALKSLFALSEAYPDLKANQNFLQLQEELTGTEGRIAYARQFFNDVVNKYNTKIQSFPAVLIARRMGFVEREYFEADDELAGPRPGPVLIRPPLYDQVTSNKRRSARPHRRVRASSSSLVVAAFDLILGGGVRRASPSPCRSPPAPPSCRTGSPTPSPWPMSRAQPADPVQLRPPAQPGRGPLHRRRPAQAPASTSSTTRRRTPSPPAATRSTPPSPSRPACSRR